MAQVVVYGLRQHLARHKVALSEIIHGALVEVLGLPAEKKFQRFISMDAEDFLFPTDRTPAYTIIEISMFEGRSEEKVKSLIIQIMKASESGLNLNPNDVEITVFQSPRYCWGIRGKTGDELTLGYKVNV